MSRLEPISSTEPEPITGGFIHQALLRLSLELTLHHPVRLCSTLVALVAVLTPMLAGMAILEGVRDRAEAAVAAGPDLFVSGYEYGRNVSVPGGLLAQVRAMKGVREARGRITGRSSIGAHMVTVAGVEGAGAPGPGDVWMGEEIAAEAGVKEGDALELADMAAVTLRVSRLIPAGDAVGAGRLLTLSLGSAQEVFGTPGRVSEILIWTDGSGGRPGADAALQVAFQLRLTGIPLRIQTVKIVRDFMDRGLTLKGGSFLALYLVALGVLIPALAVTSGFGLSSRRWEVALLKSLGFSILDIMEMAVVEIGVLALLGASLAFLLAYGWIHLLKGPILASLFVAGLEHGHPLAIPATFLPGPFLVALGLATALLSLGLIPTTYIAATARPMEVLR